MENKPPHIIVSDSDGHTYLIPKDDKDNFEKWVKACDEGKFAQMKKFDRFNTNRFDFGDLTILEWKWYE